MAGVPLSRFARTLAAQRVAPAFPNVEGPGDSLIPGIAGAVQKEAMPTSQIPGLVPENTLDPNYLLNQDNPRFDPNTYTDQDMKAIMEQRRLGGRWFGA